MHPIERIRALARATWLDPQTIAVEAADAMADAVRWMDEAVAVSIARRLLAWHPYCGPLWWVGARVLGAIDPCAEAQSVCDELLHDQTALAADVALPEGSRPLVIGPSRVLDDLADRGAARHLEDATHLLIGTSALSTQGAITHAPAADLARDARAAGIPVWAVAGLGCVVDRRLGERLCALVDGSFVHPSTHVVNTAWWDGTDDADTPSWCNVELPDLDWVCGPDGIAYPRDALARSFACPPDLLDAAGADAF
jgi:hypothetical protein